MKDLLRDIQDLENTMKRGELSKEELVSKLLVLFKEMSSQENDDDLDFNELADLDINKLIIQQKRLRELYQVVLKKQFGTWLSEKEIIAITSNEY